MSGDSNNFAHVEERSYVNGLRARSLIDMRTAQPSYSLLEGQDDSPPIADKRNYCFGIK